MKKKVVKSSSPHKTWHKFSKWIVKNFGKDLWSEEKSISIKDTKGRIKKLLKYRDFNDLELNRRLVGYDVMCKVKKYITKSCPEIKIVHCDDAVYAGSDLLLIPHPKHGITVIFIPQCTSVQNQFFLYQNYYKNLMDELRKMNYVFKSLPK